MNSDASTERREGGAGPAALRVVNMMSDAPGVQRIMCKRRYVRAGREDSPFEGIVKFRRVISTVTYKHSARRALGPDRVQDSGDV